MCDHQMHILLYLRSFMRESFLTVYIMAIIGKIQGFCSYLLSPYALLASVTCLEHSEQCDCMIQAKCTFGQTLNRIARNSSATPA